MVPPEVWAGRLGKGYVGCMRDLVINGLPSDLASYAKKQDSGECLREMLAPPWVCVASVYVGDARQYRYIHIH